MQVNFIVMLKQALSTSHFLSLTNLDNKKKRALQSHSIFIGTSVSSTKDRLLSRTASYLFCLSKFPPLSLTNQMPENKQDVEPAECNLCGMFR